jgi:predicted AAA+ superfamily ATPase
MTGKTFLLRTLQADLYIDLLDPERELQLKQSPRLFWEQISALKEKALIVLDEVQRVPALLDYVQKGIEEKRQVFVLSGSSARKLKRGGANLLGGRAKDLRLHPLTSGEIGRHFDIRSACHFGTLPRVVQSVINHEKEEARSLLRSYATTYIKEEIQAEALTRNVGAFQRFLQVAVQGNAQVIEFANISRECSVPSSTVKEYYAILEDTLLGDFLWPWDRSERKKARPKFYFFDCGVVRAIQNRLNDPPTPDEMGFLFEAWFVRELRRLRDYGDKDHEFSFWREGNHEIDMLITGGHGPILAIECKSGRDLISAQTLRAFRARFPKVPVVIASLQDQVPRRLESGVEILPWAKVLERYQSL